MKTNYSSAEFYNGLKKLNLAVLILTIGLITNRMHAQQTYTFTNCGASGQFGPTQAQVNSAYSLTNLNGSVAVVAQGIQQWTVPISGGYKIETYGAQGGVNWGLGAYMSGDFTLTAGTILRIIVGQAGGSQNNSHGSGGGASFVATGTVPLIVAGGGGGRGASSGNSPQAYSHGTTVTNGQSPPGGGPGGTGGGGGGAANSSVGGTSVSPGGGSNSSVWASGGGGFYTDGGPYSNNNLNGGRSYINNGLGGDPSGGSGNSPGGFGGGGGCGDRGAGGGGFSGGGGATNNAEGAGGGGSYNAGVNQNNTAGVNTGNGRVIITSLCNITLNSSSNPICSGTTVTLTTNAVSNYSWSNGSTASSLVITPTTTGVYSLTGTSSLNCVAGAAVNITVSPGLPVLAITSSTDNLCLGKTVTLTASGALTYTWTSGVTNGVGFTPSVTGNYTVIGQNGCGTTSAVTAITVAPLPVSVQNTPSITCAGLSTTLTASSAVNNYTWQPISLYGSTIVVNPTVNTVYTVTASDGTCSGVATLSLNTLPVPTIGVVANTSMACVGYPVTMSATGGLTYTWLPGNLSGQTVTVYPTGPTLYTVNGVNSVGCVTGTTQIVLTEISPIVNVSANSTLICTGDVVTLTAGGNAGGYMWTGGPSTPNHTVNPSSTTVYTVTGTSQTNTCTTTKVITVNVFSPSLSVASSTSSVCSGKQVTLTASGAESYFWANNNSSADFITDNPTSTTIYTVTATSTTINALSCSKTGTVQVNVNPNPTVTASSTRTMICKDESTDLNASGAQSYVWSNGATGASTVVFPAGITIHTYSVTGTDVNGCSANTTILIRVAACNSIMDHGTERISLAAYPNPAHGAFMIESSADVTVRVLNALGQEIRVINLNGANTYRSEVKGLSRGLYFISVDGKKDLTKKIVIE